MDGTGGSDQEMNPLCPFCNHVLDIEMFNGTYGCDSGCEYLRFEVECPGCNREIYRTGEFGHYGDVDDYKSEKECREEFMEEFAEAVQEIISKRKNV